MAGFRANQGDFDLDAKRLRSATEHVSVLLLNMGDINRPPHFNGKQQLPRSFQETALFGSEYRPCNGSS